MSNALLKLLCAGALIAHLIAVTASLYPARRATPLLNVNVVVAALSIAAMLIAPPTFRLPIDWQIVAGLVIEACVVALAIAALRGHRIARAPSVAMFLVHLILSAAATVFALTFSMNRLI